MPIARPTIDVRPLIQQVLTRALSVEDNNKAIKALVKLRNANLLRDNRGFGHAFQWEDSEEGHDFWYKIRYAPGRIY